MFSQTNAGISADTRLSNSRQPGPNSVRTEVKSRALIGQKSRWLKGYIQTGLIFTRKPLKTMRDMGGPVRWFVYVLFLLGTPLSILLSALSWVLTFTYFATRSPAIELLFPGLMLYLGAVLLVFGNFTLFMQHVSASTKYQGFSTVKYLVLVLTGIWPMLTMLSLAKACYELANPRMRHFWDKTEHGHDLHTLDEAVGGLRSVDVLPGSPRRHRLSSARNRTPKRTNNRSANWRSRLSPDRASNQLVQLV
jgi:hypothetical protein